MESESKRSDRSLEPREDEDGEHSEEGESDLPVLQQDDTKPTIEIEHNRKGCHYNHEHYHPDDLPCQELEEVYITKSMIEVPLVLVLAKEHHVRNVLYVRPLFDHNIITQ